MLNPAILDVDELAAKTIVVSISLTDVQSQSQSFAGRQCSNALSYQKTAEMVSYMIHI